MGTDGDLYAGAGRSETSEEALASYNALLEEMWDYWLFESDGIRPPEWDAPLPCVARGGYLGESPSVKCYSCEVWSRVYLGDAREG